MSEYAPTVVYRHHVYYPRTAVEATKFMASPRNFASLPPDALHVVTRPRCFVIGPLRSGKTSVATKIAADLRVSLVNLQEVLIKIVENGCALGELITPHLQAGDV